MTQSKRIIKLTPDVSQTICSSIKGGAFPHVAAESAGIPTQTFEEWMANGESTKAKTLYRNFYKDVQQAKAHARLMAETQMRVNDPKFWLLHGPGKDGASGHGQAWTAPLKPAKVDNRSINIIAQPQLLGFISTILQLLEPFPDARKAVAEAVHQGLVEPDATKVITNDAP